jgi:hypothetical protein
VQARPSLDPLSTSLPEPLPPELLLELVLPEPPLPEPLPLDASPWLEPPPLPPPRSWNPQMSAQAVTSPSRIEPVLHLAHVRAMGADWIASRSFATGGALDTPARTMR